MEAKTRGQLHDETKRLLKDIVKSDDDYFSLFNKTEKFLTARQKIFERVLDNYDWNMFLPTFTFIQSEQDKVYRKAIKKFKNDPRSVKTLRDFFLRPFGRWRARYDLIAELDDFESLEIVFDRIETEFNQDADEAINETCFLGLVELAKIPEYRETALEIIHTGFEKAILYAKNEKRLVNSALFNILGHLCYAIDDSRSAEIVYQAFLFAGHKDRHYRLNVNASRLLVYLTALGYSGPTESIKEYIDYYDNSYGDEEFVVRARYAYWWLQNETNEALSWLQNPEKKKSLGYVVTLLADLDEKKAELILQDRIKDLTNVVTIEVFKEAIKRLQSQQGPPTNDERMIWMFGAISETERALGADSDNVFIQRANEHSKNDNGILYEADESTAYD